MVRIMLRVTACVVSLVVFSLKPAEAQIQGASVNRSAHGRQFQSRPAKVGGLKAWWHRQTMMYNARQRNRRFPARSRSPIVSRPAMGQYQQPGQQLHEPESYRPVYPAQTVVVQPTADPVGSEATFAATPRVPPAPLLANSKTGATPSAPAKIINHIPSQPIFFAYEEAASAPEGQAKADAPKIVPASGVTPGYPQLSAPLSPVPRQDVPIQVGGTMIAHPALAPHEMLYAHSYRGLYPPFYYKVDGSWMWTPFGMESHDKWQLQGTDVRVKYHSRIGLLSMFAPPN